MLRYERIRRFSFLKCLIVKWTGQRDLERFVELLKDTEGEGDVMDRVKRERFNTVHSIELIRMYLRLDTTEELDNSWLSAEEIEEAEERALFIFRERLESEDWGLMKDFN